MESPVPMSKGSVLDTILSAPAFSCIVPLKFADLKVQMGESGLLHGGHIGVLTPPLRRNWTQRGSLNSQYLKCFVRSER